MASAPLYHGGVPGLVPGQQLLPPTITGAPSCASYDARHCRADRVYVTTDPDEAAVYAALATAGGRGDVYEVQPIGELEPDPFDSRDATAYVASAVVVVAVVRRAVPVEEAATSIWPFLVSEVRAASAKVAGPLR